METKICTIAGIIGGVPVQIITGSIGSAMFSAAACAAVAYITTQIAKYIHKKLKSKINLTVIVKFIKKL